MAKKAIKSSEPVFPEKQFLDAIKPLNKKKCKIGVFLGNGINEDGADLSTKVIVDKFVKKSASSNPRAYEEKKEAMRRLWRTLASDGSTPDMTSFMTDFQDMESLKKQFVSYVIEACCTARPGLNHFFVLALCSLLQNYGHGNHNVLAFTTNYDNLLERAKLMPPRPWRYYRPQPIFRKAPPGPRHFSTGPEGPFIIAKLLLNPIYSLKEVIKPKALSVIPVHGSIRVCRCPGCSRILMTEAAALDRKFCIYCGSEIPSVIIPTTEGETDKEVLQLLEEYISEASVQFFIGYGFGDPHIIERIKRGYLRRKSNGSFHPINICRSAFPNEKIDIKNLGEAINISLDITVALSKVIQYLIPKDNQPLGQLFSSFITETV